MNLGKWLRSLFQPETPPPDDRPLSSTPLPSRMVPKVEKLQSPQKRYIKVPNAYDKTVDAILVFLNLPENAALQQEILQDLKNFDLGFSVNKLQKAMQGKVSPHGLLWHVRDFGEALADAAHELRKTAPLLAEEQGQLDVILDAVGDRKLAVVQLIRQLTQLDLKATMTLVDNLPAPILKGVLPSKAEAAQKAFAEIGAQVSVKPS